MNQMTSHIVTDEGEIMRMWVVLDDDARRARPGLRYRRVSVNGHWEYREEWVPHVHWRGRSQYLGRGALGSALHHRHPHARTLGRHARPLVCLVPRGPWYITARAVREYAALARLGDPDDEDVWEQAEQDLLELAERTVAEGRKPRRTAGGHLRYWVPHPMPGPDRPLRAGGGSRGRPRLSLTVATGPRPEGDLPQLIHVERG